MSSTAPSADPASTTSTVEESPAQDGWRGEGDNGLAALRARLDEIDNELHDLLMRRARVIEDVAKSGKRTALRPGREAWIVRRLLSRHRGSLPPLALCRIWREMLAATTAAVAMMTSTPGGSRVPAHRQVCWASC